MRLNAFKNATFWAVLLLFFRHHSSSSIWWTLLSFCTCSHSFLVGHCVPTVNRFSQYSSFLLYEGFLGNRSTMFLYYSDFYLKSKKWFRRGFQDLSCLKEFSTLFPLCFSCSDVIIYFKCEHERFWKFQKNYWTMTPLCFKVAQNSFQHLDYDGLL